jgi:hypothetical protein
MPRYQTGIPGDLDHEVPYQNHPYARTWRWRRGLQQNSSSASDTSTGDGNAATNATETTADGSPDLFQPMRIKYFTEALDAIRDDTNGAKIDWYINTVLPMTAEFWSRALSVVPVSGNLQLSRSELASGYCGDSAFVRLSLWFAPVRGDARVATFRLLLQAGFLPFAFSRLRYPPSTFQTECPTWI